MLITPSGTTIFRELSSLNQVALVAHIVLVASSVMITEADYDYASGSKANHKSFTDSR